MKYDIIIFSKDRSMQLDLLLRSIKEYFPVNYVYVLYTASSSFYEDGYYVLFNDKDYDINVNLERESDYRKDFIKLLERMKSKYILSLSDDCCFVKRIDLNKIFRDFTEDVWGINLHLSENYHSLKEYTGSKQATLPSFIKDFDYIKWDWTKNVGNSTWGYPCGVDGNIVRRKAYIDILKTGTFTQPNEMEGHMIRNKPLLRTEMMCFDECSLINIPVNRVQDIVKNKAGEKYYYDPKELNEMYLKGYIIDTKNIYGMEVRNFYKEIEFEFVKE